MKRIIAFVAAGWLGLCAARADKGTLDDARKALADGLPTLTIYKLQQPGGKAASPEEKQQADLLMAQAYNALGRYGDTVALLKADNTAGTEAQMLRARALAALGQKEEALALYEKLAGDPAWAGEAVMGQASILQVLGRGAEAESMLSAFVAKNAANAQAVLALAEIRLSQNDPKGTLEVLNALAKPPAEWMATKAFLSAKAHLALAENEQAGQILQGIEEPPPTLAAEIAVAKSEYLINTNDLSGAEKVLEKFIDDSSQLPGLRAVFAALDRVYQRQGAASGTELRRWENDDKAPDRAALALFYLARSEARNSKVDRSRKLYRDFLDKYPNHPLAAQARTGLAASFLAAGQNAEAIGALNGAPADGEPGFLRGLALAAQEQYQQAADNFLLAANTPALKPRALFNAALCASLAGVPEEKNAAFQQIAANPANADEIDEIHLNQGLFLAAQRKPEATDLLKKLAGKEGDIGRQASLALAELNYQQLDFPTAHLQLQLVANNPDADPERVGYLGVFLTDTGGADADNQVIAKAEDFLKEYPDSTFAPEVRMKLAEVLFRRGDFLGARSQFDKVEEEAPASPIAEKAVFLSAQAMALSMDKATMEQAIERFDEVAKAGGPLALKARYYQANLYNAMGNPKDALAIFDRILASQPDADMRYATLIEKGETLFAGGPKSPDNYKQAIAIWQTIASDPAASNSYKNQALVKMGEAYQKLGDPNGALNCYYSVISQGQKGQPEYFWFYRAGFDAGQLLQKQKLWNEAIAVYEKIAAVEGPRAEEARNLVNTLRLQNFLWEN